MEAMEPVIGLEIHAQLKTKTKLFCDCPTDSGAEPNSNICEVCSGQPGALPRMNEKALKLAAKAGLALGSTVNGTSIFSRKNYFYPDLPNGFQTSQLDPPICQGGFLDIVTEAGETKRIRLNRIHLEDDAGKCQHDERRGQTLVDLNRAGVPLIEIVTEPDLGSAYEATEFLKKLHSILVRLEVTEGRMEEGEFRCDVNISLRPYGSKELGVRGEIKNLNSFRFAGQAIAYEIKRQSALYEEGKPVLQETLHFDSVRQETRSLRSKEEAHDYRYFPQPDLPPVSLSPGLIEELRKSLPESPEDSLSRLLALGLNREIAQLILDRKEALTYFDKARESFDDAQRIFSIMAELFLPACQKEGLSPMSASLRPENLAALASLLSQGTLGRRASQDIFPELFATGGDPQALAQKRGVTQITDKGPLLEMARQVVASHPEETAKFKAGQEKILSFLVGQLMRISRGAADPKGAKEAILDIIEKG
jgi:aspartyl-tRNA(Asn)/glutamyl-tRNA(Gln) amidotransferase subunit B